MKKNIKKTGWGTDILRQTETEVTDIGCQASQWVEVFMIIMVNLY